MQKNRHKLWTAIAISLIAAVAMWWLLKDVNWDITFAAWQAVPLHVWLLSASGMAASHVLRAGRVRSEWRNSLNMGWREAWALMVRHSAWVVLVPMRGGEAIYVWALHRQGGISIRAASISLVKLRLQDFAALGVIAVTIFAPLTVFQALALGVGLFATAIWVLPWIWQWLMRKFLRKEGEPELLAPPPAIESWFYAASNWIIKAAAIAWPMCVMLSIDFHTALHGSLGGELASAMPMQPPAGFGPYEAGVIFGVQWSAQIAWSHIASSALAVHLMALAVTTGSAALAYLLGWSRSDFRRVDQMQNTFSTKGHTTNV